MVVIRYFEDALECVDECLAVGHEKQPQMDTDEHR